MEEFDFEAPAEVFARRGGRTSRHPVTYRRFDTGADAVRFAIEELPLELLAGAVIEVEESRFDATDIRALYDSPRYPHERGKA